MKVSFALDRSGYPQARADKRWVVIATMLESDLYDEFLIQPALKDLRRALAGESHAEITGSQPPQRLPLPRSPNRSPSRELLRPRPRLPALPVKPSAAA